MNQTEGQKAWNEYWGHPKPNRHFKKNKHWFIILLTILCIISALKFPNHPGGFKQSGLVDMSTGLYIKSLNNTTSAINNTIDYIINQYNSGQKINIVELQKNINICIEAYEITEKNPVSKAYREFKQEQDKGYKAIIDTLQNTIRYNKMTSDIAAQISTSFIDTVNTGNSELVEIFKKTGIDYNITEDSNGIESINFRYESLK